MKKKYMKTRLEFCFFQYSILYIVLIMLVPTLAFGINNNIWEFFRKFLEGIPTVIFIMLLIGDLYSLKKMYSSTSLFDERIFHCLVFATTFAITCQLVANLIFCFRFNNRNVNYKNNDFIALMIYLNIAMLLLTFVFIACSRFYRITNNFIKEIFGVKNRKTIAEATVISESMPDNIVDYDEIQKEEEKKQVDKQNVGKQNEIHNDKIDKQRDVKQIDDKQNKITVDEIISEKK